jgi:hypothetical protein
VEKFLSKMHVGRIILIFIVRRCIRTGSDSGLCLLTDWGVSGGEYGGFTAIR